MPNTAIDLYTREYKNRPWQRVETGPFKLSMAEFYTMREEYIKVMEEKHEADPVSYPTVHGVGTAGRDILEKQCPHIKGFDAIIIGQCVATKFVKAEEYSG